MKTAKKEKKIHPFDRLQDWVVNVPKFINVVNQPWNEVYSLDVENKPNGDFLGIGVSNGKECFYWTDWKLAKQLVFKPFIAHAGAGDIGKLREWGFKVDESYLIYDTYLVEHIIDSSQKDYSLTNLTKKYLGKYYPGFKEICGKDKSFVDFAPELIAEKNFCDTYYTFHLKAHQQCRMY